MLSSETPAIDVRELRKNYGHAVALDGLDLTVHPGEVHGFLGPNGAGKSTTLRILLGLIKPTSGTVAVLDRHPWRQSPTLNAEIGYVPGDVALWPNLTGGETIDLLLGLRGGGDLAQRSRLIEAFDLDPGKKARTYSTGNRQKVALIAAFARRCPLYVLDEPTSGLDPLMEAVFRDEVARVRADGATVLLSSHVLSEVEQLCERVTIIRGGRAIRTSALTEIIQEAPTGFRVTGVSQDAIARVQGVEGVRLTDGVLQFEARTDALPQVLAALHASQPTSLVATPPTLETLFLRHYSKDGAK